MMDRPTRTTDPSRDPASRALPSIQILRALAALGVVAYHVELELATRLGAPNVLPDLSCGAAGVDLFFVISGFIMVYSSEALFGKPHASRVFFLRRLVRIVPLYWATSGVLLVYILLFLGIDRPVTNISVEAIVASFVFLPYPRPDGLMMPLHGLGWTLNYEMFFYAVFAVAIALPRVRAVAAIIAVFLAMVAVNHLLGPLPQPLAFWCAPIILEFCFGMFIGLAYRHGLRLPRLAAYGLVAAGLLAIWAIGFSAADVSSRVLQWGLPAAAIVGGFVLCRNAPQPGALGRALAFLGDASYSLYLLHVLAINATRPLLLAVIDPQRFPWVAGLLLVAVSVAAACVAYLLFERPVTRALNKAIAPARAAAEVERFGVERGSYPTEPG